MSAGRIGAPGAALRGLARGAYLGEFRSPWRGLMRFACEGGNASGRLL